MGLPQAARWKAADKEIPSLEKHHVFEMIQITQVPAGHEIVGTELQSIRMVLASVVELDNEVYMLDVQTAFLNADVEEDVFVKMAPGYETNNKAGVYLVRKLKKTSNGLWQSTKNWFGTVDVEFADPPAQVGSERVHLRGRD